MLALALAEQVGRLHAQNVCHLAFGADAFLVEQQADGWSVSVARPECVRFSRELDAGSRVAALARLNCLAGGVSVRGRIAFLRKYNSFGSCKLDRQAIREIARPTQARRSGRSAIMPSQ